MVEVAHPGKVACAAATTAPANVYSFRTASFDISESPKPVLRSDGHICQFTVGAYQHAHRDEQPKTTAPSTP